jgi:hypothetical protein
LLLSFHLIAAFLHWLWHCPLRRHNKKNDFMNRRESIQQLSASVATVFGAGLTVYPSPTLAEEAITTTSSTTISPIANLVGWIQIPLGILWIANLRRPHGVQARPHCVGMWLSQFLRYHTVSSSFHGKYQI